MAGLTKKTTTAVPGDRAELERELKRRVIALEVQRDTAKLLLDSKGGRPYDEAKVRFDAIQADLEEAQRKLRAFYIVAPEKLELVRSMPARETALSEATRLVGACRRALEEQGLPAELIDTPTTERPARYLAPLTEALKARHNASCAVLEAAQACAALEACIPRALTIALSSAGADLRRYEAAVRDARRELVSLNFALKFNAKAERKRGRVSFDDNSGEARDHGKAISRCEEQVAEAEAELVQARETERLARIAWEEARDRLLAGVIA
ncbi:MAG TPA: hypothetical protein VFF73_41085 [Planctomycetota bacterium]|nr:hypothetical protein [Planctomycetota bacterium]